jgi:cell wall-associated NlpC family hydrolase
VLAGFVLPLALVGHSRGARAGRETAVAGPVLEREGGVAAPPFAASAAATGRVGIGLATHAERAAGGRHRAVRSVVLTALAAPAATALVGPPAAVPLGPSTTTAPPGIALRLDLAIAAANSIATLPYVWGGGHGSFESAGYDCSGSVSYVLHAALALTSPEDSAGLETYGAPGPGRWITIYANAGHAFMTLGGLRFDTAGLSSTGSRWQSLSFDPTGYVVRHPVGL